MKQAHISYAVAGRNVRKVRMGNCPQWEMFMAGTGSFIVAEALDPLGIDFHVEIETPELNRSTVRSSTTSSSASVSPQDEKEEKIKDKEAKVANEKDKSPSA